MDRKEVLSHIIGRGLTVDIHTAYTQHQPKPWGQVATFKFACLAPKGVDLWANSPKQAEREVDGNTAIRIASRLRG